ncbi:MAG: hypothetical protein DRR16_23825, partial [Candidatus Parabeggiatoa sp. nov. 3]
ILRPSWSAKFILRVSWSAKFILRVSWSAKFILRPSWSAKFILRVSFGYKVATTKTKGRTRKASPYKVYVGAALACSPLKIYKTGSDFVAIS